MAASSPERPRRAGRRLARSHVARLARLARLDRVVHLARLARSHVVRLARLARARSPRGVRRAAWIALGLAVAPWLLLAVLAAFTELPPALRAVEEPAVSTVILDRHGTVLRELRAGDGARARWLPLDEAGDRIQRALLAAEDRRFALHPGVDPLAIARALGQLVAERRVVSGASTITQQLARTLEPRPRTVRGKLGEMALALRIEASLSKREILEQYLNRVAFGPGLRGVEAASRFYFDKPTRDLSLAEAAALASMPRGPALYDPRRGTGLLERRRNRVLDRMLAAGLADAGEVARARAEPIALAPRGAGLGAPHLVRAVLSGALGDGGASSDGGSAGDAASASAERAAPSAERAAPLRGRASAITLTIDRGLQREIEVLAQQTVRGLTDRDVGAAAVVVLENATGDILAYVGSHDIEDEAGLGHNDGVLALRQPGSALKPFVYELAMEQLGFTAATVLPDVELSFPTPSGSYVPRNYDGRFHGPVRLREALASSYNVPAVWTAAALGPDRVVARLRELGFGSLDREPSRYGVAIALGDGEVRLLDLANAYATLARGGIHLPVRAVRAALGPDGAPIALGPGGEPAGRGARVLDPVRARVIVDILADDKARLASFGAGSALDLPFPVAAKTGTSKGFRDNLAVGFTPDVTVAVWVGNFDGSPMGGVSGITGAGPLFRDAMLAAARLYPPRPFDPPDPEKLAEVEICSLSGMRPAAACPHRRTELLPRDEAAALAPCDMHEVVRIDRRNGLRAGACPAAEVEERTFERYDAQLAAWARAAGRPVAPDESSPLCAPLPGASAAPPARMARVRVAYPPDGARFVLDPSVNSVQAIRLRADVPPGVRRARFVLDGRPIEVGPPFALDWPLVAGAHRLRVEADGALAGEEIEFRVE